MEDIKVKLSCGEVTLRKPKAGMRNKALISAETADGFKRSLMMVELLPACIGHHPWGMTPVKKALDNLEIEEYDLLIDRLEQLIKPSEDLKKKLTDTLDQEEKEETGPSESKVKETSNSI